MREILFRGNRKDNGEWAYWNIYGEFCTPKGRRTRLTRKTPYGEKYYYYIYELKQLIDPETVGQFTGLTDKNGKKIFEGDILNNEWCFAYGNSVVKFGTYKTLDMTAEYQQGHLGFHLEHTHEVDKRSMRMDLMFFANKGEIVGNIHDNPEFLKGGEKE